VVKLVDFGLVKLVEDDLHLTKTGMVCGTPLYMSPEQASNQKVDPRSDIYSMGATYYALLAGKPPFNAAGLPQILLSHVVDPTPDPREVCPDIPEACVQVLMRAMEKKPEARYQSAAEMVADLESILSNVPQRNASIFSMQEMLPTFTPQPSPFTGRSTSFAGQSLPTQMAGRATASIKTVKAGQAHGVLSRRSLLGFAGLSALGLSAGGWYVLRGRHPTTNDHGSVSAAGMPKAAPQAARVQEGKPIKIGILHSLSGSLAVSERPLVDATVLAVEEIDSHGGLLGQKMQPVVMDGKSEVKAESAFTHATEKLLEQDKVAVVFGGFGSAGRKAMRPFFEKYDHLLFYPAQYEGLEESQNVIYTGATPNQLAIPAIRWSVEALHAKRFYLIGTDGLRAHAMNAIIEDTVKELGGQVVGSQYALVGEFQFAPNVKKIWHAKPDIIINTLVGDSIVSFFKGLVEAGVHPSTLPVLSLTMGENELALLGNLDLSGHFVARTRFARVPGAQGESFSQRFKKKYGEHRPVTETMEAAYYGVHLWAAAVMRAGTTEASKVRTAIKERSYDVEGVTIRIDASNQHAWKVFEVGRLAKGNRIETIRHDDMPIPPIPFPGPRTRAEWEAFTDSLYQKWGENWANPFKPHIKKGKRH